MPRRYRKTQESKPQPAATVAAETPGSADHPQHAVAAAHSPASASAAPLATLEPTEGDHALQTPVSSASKADRIAHAGDMLLAPGSTYGEVIQMLRSEFGISRTTAVDDVRLARIEIQKSGAATREQARAAAIRRTTARVREADRAGMYGAANQGEAVLAKIQGYDSAPDVGELGEDAKSQRARVALERAFTTMTPARMKQMALTGARLRQIMRDADAAAVDAREMAEQSS